MRKKIIENEIEYNLVGDYYIPNLKVDLKGFKTYSELGKYARLRLDYLKRNKKATYQIMFINGTLYLHLQDVQNIAQSRVDELVKKLAEQENVNEDLKAKNQLKWMQCMKNIKNRAEEVILKEVVYEEV